MQVSTWKDWFTWTMFNFSMTGFIILCVASVHVTPPPKFPHLWPLLISIFSAVHFVIFAIYFNLLQIKVFRAVRQLEAGIAKSKKQHWTQALFNSWPHSVTRKLNCHNLFCWCFKSLTELYRRRRKVIMYSKAPTVSHNIQKLFSQYDTIQRCFTTGLIKFLFSFYYRLSHAVQV